LRRNRPAPADMLVLIEAGCGFHPLRFRRSGFDPEATVRSSQPNGQGAREKRVGTTRHVASPHQQKDQAIDLVAADLDLSVGGSADPHASRDCFDKGALPAGSLSRTSW